MTAIPNDHLAEKCAHCHLFVEPNDAFDPTDPTYGALLAEYVHLHRGDAADEALDESHEAKPSGMKANLAVWRAYGPREMRERFTDAWVCSECTAVIIDESGISDQHEEHCSLHSSNVRP